mmetsp:Transcript_755/g.2315  ORF Transcript_755/g.2315 Transcript_755/m.2315 type:complete len:204 (+) Transcript_755:2042-2653(+)
MTTSAAASLDRTSRSNTFCSAALGSLGRTAPKVSSWCCAPPAGLGSSVYWASACTSTPSWGSAGGVPTARSAGDARSTGCCSVSARSDSDTSSASLASCATVFCSCSGCSSSAVSFFSFSASSSGSSSGSKLKSSSSTRNRLVFAGKGWRRAALPRWTRLPAPVTDLTVTAVALLPRTGLAVGTIIFASSSSSSRFTSVGALA